MGRGDAGIFLRCLQALDERVSVKLLLRVWGPRFEFIVRLILVATFLDDSFRAASHFSEHIKQVGEQGYLKPLAATSPELVDTIALLALGLGLLAQSFGAICLLLLVQPESAIKALLGWVIAQPVLYAQLANFDLHTPSGETSSSSPPFTTLVSSSDILSTSAHGSCSLPAPLLDPL